MSQPSENPILGRGLLLLMTTAITATAANLCYNQPLLPSIGDSLGLKESALGLIPSATQIGYAFSIFFISPLGDKLDRRMLIRNLSISLSIALLGVYFAPNFWVLILATFLIGASANITQQILPFAALLSTPENKGKVISTLMIGLTAGLLLSRTLSGLIAEHFGWRSVFLVSFIITVIFGVLMNLFLPKSAPTSNLSYVKLLGSMFTLLKTQPLLREAAFTGALWFAAFNALWATLAIHVSGEPFSYSVQQIGLFGLVGMAGIFGATVSGRLVNKVGPRLLITVSLVFVFAGFLVMAIWSNSLWALIVGIILLDLGVFGAQIPNQVRIFALDQKAQSRINAVYMLFYFIGASLGSAVGVSVMSHSGWIGLSVFGMILPLVALVYHLRKGKQQPCVDDYTPSAPTTMASQQTT